MGTINKARQRGLKAPEPHANWMAGPSYDLSPILRLKVAAASCFFGEPQYYHRDKVARAAPRRAGYRSTINDGDASRIRETLGSVVPSDWRALSPSQLMERAIDEALNADPEETLRFAVELRQKLNIRTTPQVIMVRAARHPKVKGTSLLAKYSSGIMQRLDEPCVQMAYHLSAFGKPIPSNLKRAWARRLEKAQPFELAKYRMEGREVNLYDVVNVCHPSSDAVSELMKGRTKQTGENETWEAVRSKAGKVETAEQAQEVWTAASKKMGHMALLRNLRNLEANKALTDELLDQLVEGAATGRQLPFRYYSAFRAMACGRGRVQDAIEEAMVSSLGNLPQFSGRVMSLVDNSGSAHGTMSSSMGTVRVSEIGNLMGVLTAKVADDGYVGVFGDRLESLPVRKRSSIFDDLAKVNKTGQGIGQGTENGIWLFWKQAIEKKEHWDHVFVYSDMQAGHGGLYGVGDMSWCPIWKYGTYIDVPKLIAQYRAKVNPNVRVYLVQIAGYQDTLIPEFYDKTYILGGWSEEILRFATYMQQVQK